MSESREAAPDQPGDVASGETAPRDALDRILATEDAHAGLRVFGGRAAALQDEATALGSDRDGEQLDRDERAALRRDRDGAPT